MAQQIDLSGNDIVVGSIYSGASTAGATGTIVASSDLSGITAGTVTASKAVVVDASKNIATFGTVGMGALTCTSVACTSIAAASGAVGCGTVTLVDGANLVAGSTSGAQIGTAATQKLGFFGATPVVLPATTGTTSGAATGAGSGVKVDSTYTGNSGSTAYTVGDIVRALKSLGLLTS